MSELMSVNMSLNLSEPQFLHTVYKKLLVLRQATGGQARTGSITRDQGLKNESQK